MYYLPQLPQEHNQYFLPNKYTKCYFTIITKALNREKILSEIYENHHILPKAKSMFPQYANLKKFVWNGVLLTLKEHYIVHLLLIKMTENKARSAMFLGYKRMSVNYPHSKMYAFFREKFYNKKNHHWTGRKHTEESKKKISLLKKGHKPSEETRCKMSLVKKGKHLSEETKQKLSLAFKGRTSPNLGVARNQSSNQKTADSKSQIWKIIFPDGTLHIIKNLNNFCKEHQLNYGNLNHFGKTKGFRAEKFNPQ